MKKLPLLFLLAGIPAFANVPSQSINEFNWLSTTLDTFVQNGTTIFVGTALNVLQGFAIWVFAFLVLTLGVESVIGRTIIHPMPLLKFIWTYGLLTASLHYYNAPLPIVGSSIHTIFSDASSIWSGLLTSTVLTDVALKIETIHSNMTAPYFPDVLGMIAYYIVLFLLASASGIMTAITTFGFVALGIGAVLGPLSIMLAQLPWFSHLLQNWINFMFKYAMWRLVAGAIVYVWGNTLLAYFTWIVNGDYTAGHFISILMGMISITLSFVYSLIMVPHLVNDLYGGSHSGGAASAGLVAMAARVILKR